jgi:hypothetical protein
LWLEARRRPPQPKLKRKFVKQLLRISLEPITPKHQPPKIRLEELVGEDRLFFGDFADFANVINERLSEEYVRGSWWLEELPETSLSGYTYNFGRSYAVFYNRAQVGKLNVQTTRSPLNATAQQMTNGRGVKTVSIVFRAELSKRWSLARAGFYGLLLSGVEARCWATTATSCRKPAR